MHFHPARLIAVALVSVTVAGCAQFPGGGTRTGMGSGPPVRDGARDVGTGLSSPMIQVQLDQLEDDLRIAKEQQSAWNRYAERVAVLMEQVRRGREPVSTPTGSAIEQLDALVVTARGRVTAVEGIADAGRELYPKLTPEQRVIADRRLARMVAPAVGLSSTTTGAATGAPARRP